MLTKLAPIAQDKLDDVIAVAWVQNASMDGLGSTMCDFHNFGLIFARQCTVWLKG